MGGDTIKGYKIRNGIEKGDKVILFTLCQGMRTKSYCVKLNSDRFKSDRKQIVLQHTNGPWISLLHDITEVNISAQF